MAGELAGDTMVFELLQPGDDYVPLEDHLYQHLIQVDERRESRALELPRHGGGAGYSFVDGHLRPEEIASLEEAEEEEVLLSAARHAAGLDMEPWDDDDDERFAPPVPRLPSARPSPFCSSRAGFGGGGGVPAAPVAAAVDKFEVKRYGGPGDGCTSADSTGCVICIQDYEVGDELTVVPCPGRHRFHQRCLAVWLARKRLCPLCRHALPA